MSLGWCTAITPLRRRLLLSFVLRVSTHSRSLYRISEGIFRLFITSVILKGHSLYQRWVRLLQPACRPRDVPTRDGDDAIAHEKRYGAVEINMSIIKFNVSKSQQTSFIS